MPPFFWGVQRSSTTLPVSKCNCSAFSVTFWNAWSSNKMLHWEPFNHKILDTFLIMTYFSYVPAQQWRCYIPKLQVHRWAYQRHVRTKGKKCCCGNRTKRDAWPLLSRTFGHPRSAKLINLLLGGLLLAATVKQHSC